MSAETKHSIAEMTGTWNGTLHQYSHDIEGTFPVIMTINHLDHEKFSGTMDWPDFGNCQTRVRGHFNGTRLIFTETEYLKGDDVVLNGLYVATFSGKDKIKGEWMDPKHTIHPVGPDYGIAGASFVFERKNGARSLPERQDYARQ